MTTIQDIDLFLYEEINGEDRCIIHPDIQGTELGENLRKNLFGLCHEIEFIDEPEIVAWAEELVKEQFAEHGDVFHDEIYDEHVYNIASSSHVVVYYYDALQWIASNTHKIRILDELYFSVTEFDGTPPSDAFYRMICVAYEETVKQIVLAIHGAVVETGLDNLPEMETNNV